MRNRAALVLMEQLVMVLVFALAAAACLGIFVGARQTALSAQRQDDALILAQNGAETVKLHSGDFPAAAAALQGSWNGSRICVSYDDALSPAANGTYLLTVQAIPSGVPGLGQAQVWVTHRDDPEQVLLSVTVGWQEVA